MPAGPGLLLSRRTVRQQPAQEPVPYVQVSTCVHAYLAAGDMLEMVT